MRDILQTSLQPSALRLLAVLATCCLAVSAAPATAAELPDALRVCADPHYMPFSSKDRTGFENRIADMIGKDLGLPVQYDWFPQRMGFIRNTLRAEDPVSGRYKCDLVMGVPDDFELAITTKPYYRSTYALVYVRGRGLDDVKSPADLAALSRDRRDKLRIGMHERNPGVQWLQRNDMLEQLVPYVAQLGDPDIAPGQLEGDDLLAGKLDAAILWGPLAGYLAKRAGDTEVAVLPLQSGNGMKFDFAIAAAVRFGEKAWRDTVQASLDRHTDEIQALLREFRVPLVTN